MKRIDVYWYDFFHVRYTYYSITQFTVLNGASKLFRVWGPFCTS